MAERARRITALWLPRFAIERWLVLAARRGEDVPPEVALALARPGTHGPVIHATTRAAELAGVQAGARAVDMRALCPVLRLEPADTEADSLALERLMLWLRRFCPWTAVDGAGGVILDTTGSDHLWGGEAAMLVEIETALSHLGLSAGLAIAPTPAAARALARFGGVRAISGADQIEAQIAPLPVAALGLGADTVLLLQRLGLKTIGDLAAVPRLSLARRFNRTPAAENPLIALDRMTGRLPTPLDAPADPPRYLARTRLADPVQDPTPWIPALCEDLCAALTHDGMGARRITLTLYRTDGEIAAASVATARASRDAAHLARLFEGRLDRLDPGFGFDLITLVGDVTEALAVRQRRLDGAADDAEDLARLTDRLRARLGPRALTAPAPRPSHIPERAVTWAGHAAPLPASAPPVPRPLRMLDHPEELRVLYAVPEGPPAQFVWRRRPHRVVRFAGPERIAPEWWADKPGTRLRDYYRVEDHEGHRFWIYRDGVLGDGRGQEPRWFLQGLFV